MSPTKGPIISGDCPKASLSDLFQHAQVRANAWRRLRTRFGGPWIPLAQLQSTRSWTHCPLDAADKRYAPAWRSSHPRPASPTQVTFPQFAKLIDWPATAILQWRLMLAGFHAGLFETRWPLVRALNRPNPSDIPAQRLVVQRKLVVQSMPVSDAIGDLHSRDLIISKLRWYVAGLERRLAAHPVSPDRNSMGGDAGVGSLLFSLGDHGSVLSASAVAADHRLEPGILDLGDDGGQAFEAVARVQGGFWVHPRPGKLSVACVGPFDGPPPVLVTAKVQVENPQGPAVGFCIDSVRTQLDENVLLETAKKRVERGFEWAEVTPSQSKALLSLDSGGSGQWGKWALILATKSLEDPRVEFAWATFKDIAFYQLAGDRLERSTVA